MLWRGVLCSCDLVIVSACRVCSLPMVGSYSSKKLSVTKRMVKADLPTPPPPRTTWTVQNPNQTQPTTHNTHQQSTSKKSITATTTEQQKDRCSKSNIAHQQATANEQDKLHIALHEHPTSIHIHKHTHTQQIKKKSPFTPSTCFRYMLQSIPPLNKGKREDEKRYFVANRETYQFIFKIFTISHVCNREREQKKC